VAGEPKEKPAGEEGDAREAAERGSFARERERLLERERAARAEAERARQETRAILEGISDGFFALDRERRFVYVNREAERFWGKPREELVGKDIREVFPRAVGSEGYRAIERAAKGGVPTEFEAASSVVAGAWVAGRVYPSAEGLSVYFRDDSQRKRAEEALKEREEFVRQLLRNFPNGSVNVFDRDLRYLLAEGRGLAEEGLSPEMLVGKTLDELFPKESADLVRPYYRRAFGGEDVEFELPLGGRVYSIHAAPLREEDGEVRTIIAVAQNVTERERAQEERERLLAREWKARAEAEERRRISRELHDRVAHAMGVAHQSLELHDALKHSDPEAARAKMGLAKETTVEAMRLTRNLAQELRGAEAQGSLSGALSGLLDAAVPPGLERAVSVEGDEALVPPHVREELFVILREGVRNAVSHSGAGRIDVGVRVSPEEVVGRVEDDGRGLAEEEGAAGGGMQSMRERAQLLGGTFELSSGPGVGTTIRASIPLERGVGNGT
jgi:PAS domain S-box-containing protein